MEIGRQNLNSRLRPATSDSPDTCGKLCCALVRQIVTCHGRDDDVVETELKNTLSQTFGFVWFGR
jgi:hypothetical protein